MRVLLLDAYRHDDPDRELADLTASELRDRGHVVDRLDLYAEGFDSFMSTEERRAYHESTNLLCDATIRSAALVKQVDAIAFCYPTVLETVPAVLKSWLERVLIPDVAFVFDKAGRIAPGMTNVRRLGALTTSAAATKRRHDLGRRTLLWSLRLNCRRTCRTTFARFERADADQVRAALRRW